MLENSLSLSIRNDSIGFVNVFRKHFSLLTDRAFIFSLDLRSLGMGIGMGMDSTARDGRRRSPYPIRTVS